MNRTTLYPYRTRPLPVRFAEPLESVLSGNRPGPGDRNRSPGRIDGENGHEEPQVQLGGWAAISPRRRAGGVASRIRVALLITALSAFVLAPVFADTAPADAKAQVAKLVAVLKSEASQKDKADACRELARLGSKDAIAPLVALLPDENLSHMARYGLETIADPAVDAAFREALPKLRGRPLLGVIGSLGVRQDARAVKLLTALLGDADPEVVQAAAKALGRIGTPAAATALGQALPAEPNANQLAVCEGLLRCADSLAAKGQRKRALAIYDHLRTLQAPHQVRTAAWRGAILVRQKDGLALLRQGLRSENFALFAAATRISREMPGAEVTRVLAGEMQGASADRQMLLISTLANRRDSSALPGVSGAARSGEKIVRLTAIRALPQFEDAAALPALLELMTDPDREIAQVAQESLAALPGRTVDLAVLGLLASQDPAQQITGIELIVRRRMTAAVPDLLRAAGNSNPQVRLTALKKLGELAGLDQMPDLLDLLEKAKSGSDLDAAEQALSAVCVLASKPDVCSEALAARLALVQPAQKTALLRVLGAVGGAKALQSVRAALNDPSPETHTTAVRTLAAWNNVEAAPALLELARSAGDATEKMLCLRSYLGFAGHSDVPADQRLEMCRQAAPLVQKDEERKLLLAALGGLGSVDALELITGCLDNPGTKEEACTALVAIAEKLLQGNDSLRNAPKLVQPLEKVAQLTSNDQLAQRAKALLEKARTK
jgi:HEAT repeat protein